MKTMFIAAASLCCALLCPASAADLVFKSGQERTHLLELYTSEGCSSCPPADRWISQLKTSPRLWKEIVPMAFHVDYWDGLGWPDRFASKLFTERQRAYSKAWNASSIYTPEFVLDGREWQARSLDGIPAPAGNAGRLSATLHENSVMVVYLPAAPSGSKKWEAHVALLGSGLVSDVKKGENSGRKLTHDFVVLAHETSLMNANAEGFKFTMTLPSFGVPMERSLAIWITEAGQMSPVQAAGGPL